MTRLTHDLLDVSRIAAGRLEMKPDRTDLAEVVRDVVDRFGDGESPIVLEAEPVVGNWDAFRIDQVVTNLISNSVKYGQGRPIHVTVRREDDAAQIVVRDQGIGIAPEDLPFIFGRFERKVSLRNYGGLGLGLYIARQIVEAHDGTIAVESVKGEGATFTVTLPL
jgi:signal transduction histidine kinase